MNMRRRKVRLILLSKPVWMMMGRENIEKSIDCWGNWIRQHKETLSRVSGKGKRNTTHVDVYTKILLMNWFEKDQRSK